MSQFRSLSTCPMLLQPYWSVTSCRAPRHFHWLSSSYSVTVCSVHSLETANGWAWSTELMQISPTLA